MDRERKPRPVQSTKKLVFTGHYLVVTLEYTSETDQGTLKMEFLHDGTLIFKPILSSQSLEKLFDALTDVFIDNAPGMEYLHD